jgi:hypothetical protein
MHGDSSPDHDTLAMNHIVSDLGAGLIGRVRIPRRVISPAVATRDSPFRPHFTFLLSLLLQSAREPAVPLPKEGGKKR